MGKLDNSYCVLVANQNIGITELCLRNIFFPDFILILSSMGFFSTPLRPISYECINELIRVMSHT